ncbi:MAG: response regulator transcription factor [Clostridiales bacterium]|nr:response regulator transcription factor [Clostridiales bacterium]
MRIVVCDDDRVFGERFIAQIKQIVCKSEWAYEEFEFQSFSSPRELITYMRHNGIDILFLDISMPHMDGFEVAKLYRETEPEGCLIFISDIEQKFFSSFQCTSFRFLCKSSYQEYLSEAIQTAIEKWHTVKEYLVVSNRETCTAVKISHIIYIEKEKQKNYLFIYCRNHTYRYRSTISELEKTLDANGFVQINASQLINVKYIEKMENDSVTLITDVVLNASRQCGAALKYKYKMYMRNR